MCIEKIKNLKYIVLCSKDDAQKVDYDKLKQCNKNTIYIPGTPKLSYSYLTRVKSIETLEEIDNFNIIRKYPNFLDVKKYITNSDVRKILRDINTKPRRHYVWGMFWTEKPHKDDLKKCENIDKGQQINKIDNDPNNSY